MSHHSNALADNSFAPTESDFWKHVEPHDLEREHGGDVFTWARKTGLAPREIIDFSASINPLGPPPLARRAFLKSYGEISCYPDVETHELKEALAYHHGVKPEEVHLGNGSTQLIYLLCRALTPCKALVVVPAFSEYSNGLKLAGAKVQPFALAPECNFRLSLQKFHESVSEKPDIVFLANPNSVTGQLLPREEMEEIASLTLRRRIFLIVDEAFMDFIERETVKTAIQRNPYLIVLRSLTKYYAIPGLRIGYLLAQRAIIELLNKHQEPWSVSGPAQRVALACLTDTNFRLKIDQWLERERSFLLQGLHALKGFHPYPSRTNFLLVRLEGSGVDALQLRSFLLRRKILIRSCDSFLGLGAYYFRVAVRRREDNKQLLKALNERTV